MDLWRLAWQNVGGNNTAPPGAGDTYAETLLALSPTLYYRLGEASGDLADSSGNSHTLTATGLAYGASGWPGDDDGAVTFGGSGDYATASDHADFDVGTSDFSVAFCLKRNGTPADTEAILCHDWQGYGADWGVGLSGTSSILAVMVGNGYNLNHTATLYDDAWHHCVVTCDRSGVATLYVDSVSVGTVDISADVATDLTNARPLWLGATSDVLMNLTGSLDEVAFWKSTLLTSGNVSALYAARNGSGSPTPPASTYASAVLALAPDAYYQMDEPSGTVMFDSSTTGNDGSYYGSPTLGVAGPFTGATGVTFNGTDQWAQAPWVAALDGAAGDDWSVVLWMKTAATTSGNLWLFGRPGNDLFDNYELVHDPSLDRLGARFGKADESDAMWAHSSTTTNLNSNTWRMVAITADRDGNATFYVDGSAYGTADISAYQHEVTGAYTMYLARRGIGGYWAGTMSQAAVWMGTLLSGADITTLWTASGGA